MSSRSAGALEEIRTLLLSGTLQVGDRLQEIALAESLGVSRTPVREALHRLEADGIDERTGRGYVVADVDPRTEAEIATIRNALEPVAAELAAGAVADGFIAPVRIAELRGTVADLEVAGSRGDAAAAASANHRFHTLIGELSMNAVLSETIMRLNDRLVIATRARLSTADWAREASVQHAAIVSAIEAGDSGAASSAVRSHLSHVGRNSTDGSEPAP